MPARCIPISRSIRHRRCRRWCAASTRRLRAPTRSPSSKATIRPIGMAPIVADAEAGFGGPLNAFELMKAMIEAGAAGVHFEDQLASEKKCGHLGGKVLVPTQAFIRTLNAARLAADVCGVPTIVMARTDAHSATLITTDVDERDHPLDRSREPNAGGLLPIEAGQHAFGRTRHRTRLELRALCGPHLVGDLGARSRRGARIRGRDASPSSPASSSPIIARPPSTGAPSSTARPSRASRRRSPPWATASSS